MAPPTAAPAMTPVEVQSNAPLSLDEDPLPRVERVEEVRVLSRVAMSLLPVQLSAFEPLRGAAVPPFVARLVALAGPALRNLASRTLRSVIE